MKRIILFFCFPFFLSAQSDFVSGNIFQTDYFIENRGQFDHEQEGKQRILYSTEMPFGNVFFHKNGFSIKQQKTRPKKIHEQLEYSFSSAELMEKTIQLEWIGANPNCELVRDVKSNHYFSFGPEEYKSYGYKKLTYKNIYPNIDIVYTIEDNSRFHYSILLHKGAKVSDIKMKYNNVDVNVLDGETSLELRGTVFPVYEFGLKCNKLNQAKDSLPCIYALSEDEIGFKIEGVDLVKEELEIDPWVASVTTLIGTGEASQVGYDVDYDYNGNLYVFGGGSNVSTPANSLKPKIASYNNVGALLWTFNCEIPSIPWNSLLPYNSVSNFIVDKNTNKIYTGEGYNFSSSRVIRLKPTGIYDTFISNVNSQFQESWDFQFNCNTGGIIALGGGTNSNLNMGEINKVNANLSASNITNLSVFYQDIVSSCMDKNGSFYVIFSPIDTTLINRIYKVNSTLNGHVWNVSSGSSSFVEAKNKFYFSNVNSNGFNALCANRNYLFYYDGKNLKAFNLVNGNKVGDTLIIPSHFVKEQGGIESDDCNNVYVGGNNGNILIYNFDGSKFNYKRQIFFNGHVGKSVYDLKANKGDNKLYVSGAGFVAETYFTQCDSELFVVNLSSTCSNTAIANVINYVPSSKYSYQWIDTATNAMLRSKLNSSHISDTLTSAGGRIVKLIVTRISDCLPAKLTKFVSFKPDTFIHPKTVFKCLGESHTIGTRTYTTSGIYLDTLQVYGCPKIFQTNLTFLPSSLDSTVKYICPGENFGIRGKKIINSGIYMDTMANRFGCDSIIKYNINVVNSNFTTQSIFDTICYGSKMFFNNQLLDSTSSYKDTLMNQYGCDSVIITLNLFVRKKLETKVTAAICLNQSYFFKKVFLKTAGTYYDTLKDKNNCDSFVTLTLSVDSFLFRDFSIRICSPQSYSFKSQNLSISGTYYDTIKNATLCDSIVKLSLFVGNPSTSTFLDTICSNQSYFFNQQTLNTSGTYLDTFMNRDGCDSVITLILKVNDYYRQTINTSICDGEQYMVGNNIFRNSGSYTIVLKSIYNCDSIIDLNLVVNKKYFFTQSERICSGVSFGFFGQEYRSSGVYQEKFKTIYGCDSIYELRLKVTEISGISQREFCNGDSSIVKNRYVKTSGDYYDTFKLPSGCDSFHLTRVTVKPWTAQHIDTVLCIGDSFIYKNKAYTKPGIIRDTFFSDYKTTCHQLYFVHLDFTPCDTMNECQRILIPTGFSPNLDGINDKLAPIVKSELVNILNFEVYNRWGQLVYNYFDDKNGWSGMYRGEEAPIGAYNFQLKYKCKEKLFIKSGNVTLLR